MRKSVEKGLQALPEDWGGSLGMEGSESLVWLAHQKRRWRSDWRRTSWGEKCLIRKVSLIQQKMAFLGCKAELNHPGLWLLLQEFSHLVNPGSSSLDIFKWGADAFLEAMFQSGGSCWVTGRSCTWISLTVLKWDGMSSDIHQRWRFQPDLLQQFWKDCKREICHLLAYWCMGVMKFLPGLRTQPLFLSQSFWWG